MTGLTPLTFQARAWANAALLCLTAVSLAAQPVAPRGEGPKEDDSAPTKTLEPVEVTGSRIKRVEVEGPSPIKIITREELSLVGHASLTEALREMPEAGFSAINESGTTSAVRGSTALNLRDMGANNTLIIVNGRRAVQTGRHADGNTFVDLNRFPISMVERIEILKDGASAIYGADATAGVVNVILRKDFKGTEATFTYGNSRRSDVSEKAWTLFTGAARGKLSATLGLNYYTRNALKATDVDFAANADLSARYLAKDPKYAGLVAAGFFDLRSGAGPHARIMGVYGSPVNGQNGVNIPGLPAGFPITRLPGTGGFSFGLGFSATPSFTNPPQVGTGGQFSAAITGTYVPQVLSPRSDPSNLYNFQEQVWLTPEVERFGATSSVTYDVSKDLSLYGEFYYANNQSHIQLASPPITTIDDNQIFVPRTNYWNPFGVDVQFQWRPVDFGPRRSDVTNRTYQLLAGAKGRLRERWDWDVGYTFGRDRSTDVQSNEISESKLRQVLARSTPNALNIFGGANFRNDPAVYNEIRVRTERGGYANLAVADAKISGDLFDLPSGTVGFAAYGSWRREKFGEVNDPLSSTLNDIIAQVRLIESVDARRSIETLATELNVPLVKPARYKLLYKASLSVAASYENFSDGYDSGAKPYVGLRYNPIADLVLRASYNKSFRAPTLPQLYGGQREGFLNNLPDYRRPQAITGDPFDGPATSRLIRSSGNPNLTPEHADAYQLGFVYDVPLKTLKGLSLGTTFFHIEQTDVINTIDLNYIRLNEVGGGTGDRVVRDPNPEFYINRSGSPVLVLAGPNGGAVIVNPNQGVILPGRILYFQNEFVNIARQEIEGWDFEANYRRTSPRYGRFSLRAAATYLAFFGYTRLDRMDNLIGRASIPRIRGQASIFWERERWRGAVIHSYLGRNGDFVRDGFEVEPYQTTALSLGYDIPPGRIPWVENTRVTFGVDNVTDAKPPLYNDPVGYDQRLIGRPAGRFFFFRVQRSF